MQYVFYGGNGTMDPGTVGAKQGMLYHGHPTAQILWEVAAR